MKHYTEQEELIMQYFFGELSEEAAAEVEEGFLTDDQFFEQMLSMEDALIDAYVQGELSEVKRTKVEASLSSHRQLRELNFVRDLIADLARTKSLETKTKPPVLVERPSRLRAIIAFLDKQDFMKFAVAFVILAFGVILAAWNLRLQNKLAGITAEHVALVKKEQELRQEIDRLGQDIGDERSRRNDLEQEVTALQELSPTIRRNNMATISLTTDSFLRDGGELEVVHIRPGMSRLQIRISLSREFVHQSYDAVIHTFERRAIWQGKLTPGRGNPGRIVITLPAPLFADGHYTLTLKGSTTGNAAMDIGDYSFRVKE